MTFSSIHFPIYHILYPLYIWITYRKYFVDLCFVCCDMWQMNEDCSPIYLLKNRSLPQWLFLACHLPGALGRLAPPYFTIHFSNLRKWLFACGTAINIPISKRALLSLLKYRLGSVPDYPIGILVMCPPKRWPSYKYKKRKIR